jgi:hypothetical protein
MRAQLGRGPELARLAFERIMFGARAPRKTGIDAFGVRDESLAWSHGTVRPSLRVVRRGLRQ